MVVVVSNVRNDYKLTTHINKYDGGAVGWVARLGGLCGLMGYTIGRVLRLDEGFISDTTARILLTSRRVPTCSWYIISKCRSKKK